MQLKPVTGLKPVLHRACCALLGGAPFAAQSDEPWRMDIGLMNYVEVDRNTGLEMIINAERSLDEDAELGISAVLDVITGATPNGATASNVPQTFTMASGDGSYSVEAGELPVDDTHMDTRLGLASHLSLIHGDRLTADYRAQISMEFDFFSLATGVDLNWDLNRKNTRLLLSIDAEYDRVHPVGNVPVPLASMVPEDELQPRGKASVTRRVQGFATGITQIISRRSLMQLKYSYAEHSGYLTDPYKLLSVIEDTDPATLGATLDYVYEHRPGLRRMQSIYTAYKHDLGARILDVSYRYLWDDWDIRSSTLELKYRLPLDNRRYIQPGIRLYHQQAANFFYHSLPASEGLPVYASADFRLAEFDALTLGIRYGKLLADDRGYSITLEYYRQQGDSSPADAIGIQQQQDLFPALHTLILKYVYSYEW